MQLKIKKLHEDAVIPHPKHKTDAGMDLYAVKDGYIPRGCRDIIKTGIAIQLPPKTEAQIRPRSGLALKRGITVLNTPGTIDEDYRGEIGVILINLDNSNDFKYKKGDRIAQMVIKPVITSEVEILEVSELDETERGSGGFGSTGS
jgi:dUTP pyrophosphatase